MDINNIINTIEALDSVEDRCISYAEIILYAKEDRDRYQLKEGKLKWKDQITNNVVKVIISEYNDIIKQCTDMMRANINYEVNKKVL